MSGMIRRRVPDSPFETGAFKASESSITAFDADSCDVASRTGSLRRLPWPPGIRGRLLLLVFTSTLPLLVVAWINLENRFRDQSLQARQHLRSRN